MKDIGRGEGMEDQYLLEGLRRQDEVCYRELIHKYGGYVIAICMRVAKEQLTKEDIEEISADVFFKVWERAKEIEAKDGTLKYYLGVLARNEAMKRVQRQGSRLISLTLDEQVEEDNCFSPENYLLKEELTNGLTQAIGEMGEPDGEIFIRRYFYEDKITEIAKSMKLNESTVRSKLSRGKKKLYNILKKKGGMINEKDRKDNGQYRTLFTRES